MAPVNTNFADTEREIIIQAHEDVAWLPDVMLTHRSRNPGLNAGELAESASASVLSLVNEGYVFLCREKWSTPPRERALRPVDRAEIAAVLANPETWVWDDSRGEYHCLAATPKGEEAFLELISRPS